MALLDAGTPIQVLPSAPDSAFSEKPTSYQVSKHRLRVQIASDVCTCGDCSNAHWILHFFGNSVRKFYNIHTDLATAQYARPKTNAITFKVVNILLPRRSMVSLIFLRLQWNKDQLAFRDFSKPFVDAICESQKKKKKKKIFRTTDGIWENI
jgi:hypothetical protein